MKHAATGGRWAKSDKPKGDIAEERDRHNGQNMGKSFERERRNTGKEEGERGGSRRNYGLLKITEAYIKKYGQEGEKENGRRKRETRNGKEKKAEHINKQKGDERYMAE